MLMDFLPLLIAVVAIVYLVVRIKAGTGRRRSRTGSASSRGGDREARLERLMQQNEEWLGERWSTAQQEQAAGKSNSVPAWFFDDATEKQLERLERYGFEIDVHPSKGQASDLIGLLIPPDDEEREVLKHFKVPLRGMNQSRARYLVAKLLSEPANVESFRNRPPNPFQKEFYRFSGLPVPKDLTFKSANQDIEKCLSQLEQHKQQEWRDFASIWEEFCDSDFRDGSNIRKVSFALFKKGVERTKSNGHTLSELAEDPELVAHVLLEMKPELEKE
jgi:hypothetical protein